MTQIIYVDRSRGLARDRCKKMRWLEYHAGPAHVGLVPVCKSIHLLIGGAVHAGMEVLLREGQKFLDDFAQQIPELELPDALSALFDRPEGTTGPTPARLIEDAAVLLALESLRKEMAGGVECDPEEEAERKAREQAATQVDWSGMDLAAPGSKDKTMAAVVDQSGDSPIMIDFGELGAQVAGRPNGISAGTEAQAELAAAARPVFARPQTDAKYLAEELAALVEGMVRAWARRKWQNLLRDFEVLEVEREGEWTLAAIDCDPKPECPRCLGRGSHALTGALSDWDKSQSVVCECTRGEIHFLSRHDALLRERSTDFLYLQSFKTTGSWDRRKELDAQVDVQGLSEAVDVEKRFDKWWHQIHGETEQSYEGWAWGADTTVKTPAIYDFLLRQAAPPTILGIRYEYILKGSRKKDKKDATAPDRYVQESILCRAWKQEGITAEDRRWAWTWDWFDAGGKSRRLDYRSWQKFPVWKFMPIKDWVDLLDRGEVQAEATTEQGEPMDALAEQFVPVVVAYRNADDARDWLEQVAESERENAEGVEAVRRAEESGDYGELRSALNRHFPQNRAACSYPGLCAYRSTSSQAGFCFGGPDPEHDPAVMERFRTRVPNHPKEGETELVQIGGASS